MFLATSVVLKEHVITPELKVLFVKDVTLVWFVKVMSGSAGENGAIAPFVKIMGNFYSNMKEMITWMVLLNY